MIMCVCVLKTDREEETIHQSVGLMMAAGGKHVGPMAAANGAQLRFAGQAVDGPIAAC